MLRNCLLLLSFCQVALKGENSLFQIVFKNIFNLNSAYMTTTSAPDMLISQFIMHIVQLVQAWIGMQRCRIPVLEQTTVKTTFIEVTSLVVLVLNTVTFDLFQSPLSLLFTTLFVACVHRDKQRWCGCLHWSLSATWWLLYVTTNKAEVLRTMMLLLFGYQQSQTFIIQKKPGL